MASRHSSVLVAAQRLGITGLAPDECRTKSLEISFCWLFPNSVPQTTCENNLANRYRRQRCQVAKSVVIAIDTVSVQNLLAPFCCVIEIDTLCHFSLLGGLSKPFSVIDISLSN